jgi:hypothetical protein
MAIYTIDNSNMTTIRAGISAALADAGILTTMHYNASNDIIFTCTRCNKVIRAVYQNYGRTNWYIGDAYDTGTTITNQVTICAQVSNTWSTNYAMIITEDVLAFVVPLVGSAATIVIFCKADNATTDYLALGWVMNVNAANASAMWDCTNDADVRLRMLAQPVISSSGYYYKSDPVVTTAGGLLRATGLVGITALHKPNNVVTGYDTYGDDVAISGGNAYGINDIVPSCLLIANGASWAPAA